MKTFIFSAALFFGSTTLAQTAQYWSSENLHADQECLLKIVRTKMKSPAITAPPQLKTESTTSLVEFQDAMAKWWGFRPDVFTNVYDAGTNTVYLSNNKAYYKFPRTPIDSLVHELTHFVQNTDFSAGKGDEEVLENQAIQIQFWFRDNRSQFIENESYRGPCQ